jgi:hypothetical protein
VELRTFVRRQSTAALVLIPLLVGVVAALFFAATQERPYEASTTVAVGEALGADPEAFGFSGRVDDFIFTIESPTVTALVRDELGLQEDETGGELSASTVGNGGLVEVSHSADGAEAAAEGLQVGIGISLAALADERLETATNEVGVIDEQIETQRARLAELELAAGGPDVTNRYRDTALEIQGLETSLFQNADDPQFDPNPVNARIAELTTRLNALGAVVNEWEQVRARLEQLGEARQTAELARLTAQRVVEEAAENDRFFATVVSRTSTLQVVALPAMAAAVAALGVVVGASMLRERNRVRASARPLPTGARPVATKASRDARSASSKPARSRVSSGR